MPVSAGPMSVRTLALSLLGRLRETDGFADELLDAEPAAPLPDPRDRGLLREIVLGVIRRRLTLDAIVAAFSSRPLDRLDPIVRDALRLGTYQLAFLERVPPHAALDETVEAVRALGHAPACGFVNGVLRAMLRGFRGPAPACADPRRDVPVEPGRWARFAEAVLPPPRPEVERLAAAHSYPALLVARFLRRMPRATAERILQAGNVPPPVVLRVNRLRANREQVIARLAEEGVAAQPGAHPLSVVLGHCGKSPAALSAFVAGWATVQDPTATAVGEALDPRPGESILDLCSSPGGKATHVAEIIENRGRVVACDVSDEKLAPVTAAARRLGITCIKTCRADGLDAVAAELGPFDRVLVDVPCSNTGVLARRAEARYRAVEPTAMTGRQAELLRRAAGLLKPGGTLVYSTCSLEPEENERLVAAFVAERPEFRLLDERTTLPEPAATPAERADGGYRARLQRAG
jgi:16S rRNA (cytosine967-C5)-methyltransferase